MGFVVECEFAPPSLLPLLLSSRLPFALGKWPLLPPWTFFPPWFGLALFLQPNQMLLCSHTNKIRETLNKKVRLSPIPSRAGMGYPRGRGNTLSKGNRFDILFLFFPLFHLNFSGTFILPEMWKIWEIPLPILFLLFFYFPWYFYFFQPEIRV